MISCFQARNVALCLSALTVLSAAGCNSTDAQAAGQTGTSGLSGPVTMVPEYQARAPRKCASVTQQPSSAQATIMVQCSMDGLTATGLGLIQDVKLEMGASRPFNNWSDLGLSGIDSNAKVVPLRGSYTGYFCGLVGTAPAGHTCLKSVVPVAEGWCWRTSFGDYKCKMQGSAPNMESGMPPPTTY
ncbi:MAG TPA: hypothetical protein VK660_05175 [Xanthomonadaceae bacterium]|jgi:hypothetical protein|nr:hypothetical protein [Xanthomonadaceae bacterium]